MSAGKAGAERLYLLLDQLTVGQALDLKVLNVVSLYKLNIIFCSIPYNIKADEYLKVKCSSVQGK